MKTKQSRILIYGAGVIGSTFGGLMSVAGYDVTLLARNSRLKELKEKGLLMQKSNQNKVSRVSVNIISELSEDDIFDIVFVTLRKDQVVQALPALSRNKSRNFVFMVNNPSGYKEWTNALGYERVIPAFPGSGGKIENGIVHYQIVSKFIQPTTLGELNGTKSTRIIHLKEILSSSGFPVTVSRNMDAWQKTHVAMVGPLGDVIYYDGGNNYTVAKNKSAIEQMNLALKENFVFLHKSGIGIEPLNLSFFKVAPLWMLNFTMKFAFNTKWAETVISNHALNARNEMKVISTEFIELAKSKGYVLTEFGKLVERI
ncbi:MAG: ketopantoate reductase family protein [Bacteroidia bacterium]|nr:ketopantoate reductase family protein [Bacteroidia bacterium]